MKNGRAYPLSNSYSCRTHPITCLQMPPDPGDVALWPPQSGSAWLSLAWQGLPVLQSIALMELFPVVLACSVWGHHWHGLYNLCHSDNQAVVSQINSLHARDPLAAHFLRCLAFFQELFDFRLRATHISGHLNVGADNLPRNKIQQFLSTHPNFSLLPTQVPPWALDLLLSPHRSDWTSPQWR